MKKFAGFVVVAIAVFFGSAYYQRNQVIAFAERACTMGAEAGYGSGDCACLAGILREEIPVVTFWTDVFSSDMGTGNVAHAERRAKKECRAG